MRGCNIQVGIGMYKEHTDLIQVELWIKSELRWEGAVQVGIADSKWIKVRNSMPTNLVGSDHGLDIMGDIFCTAYRLLTLASGISLYTHTHIIIRVHIYHWWSHIRMTAINSLLT